MPKDIPKDLLYKAAGLKPPAVFSRMRKKRIVKSIFDALDEGSLELEDVVFQGFWAQDWGTNRQAGKTTNILMDAIIDGMNGKRTIIICRYRRDIDTNIIKLSLLQASMYKNLKIDPVPLYNMVTFRTKTMEKHREKTDIKRVYDID
jgi:hypothetical protein